VFWYVLFLTEIAFFLCFQSSHMEHNGSGHTAEAVADKHQQSKKVVKQWIRSARVIFGLPNIAYSDA
jgi:hypothetical protein